ncbi:MAG: HK97 gp10 family phage protein [Pirellulales bacterium]|nr:HK97 gp10 family phage protein [Pirellulales bacterium]
MARRAVGNIQIGIDVRGDVEAKALLDALPFRVYRRVLRSAVAKATRPIVRDAKALAPKRNRTVDEQGREVGPTGLLRKSLGFVIRTYLTRGVVLGVIGPRKGFRTIIDGRPRDPIHYAHLVEFGYRIARGGTLATTTGGDARAARKDKKKHKGVHVATHLARPFLRPAHKSNERRAMSTIEREVAAGIKREAAKLAAKGKLHK